MKQRQEIVETFWYIAAERQKIFFNKLRGICPLTTDPILREYKFCNSYRASDRVSQFLIKKVIYENNNLREEDLLLRILLFRLLNKNETWMALENKIGIITKNNFKKEKLIKALAKISRAKGVIYGNAFILCANKYFGFEKKYENHLALLEKIFKEKINKKILEAKSLQELFEILKELPLIGDFMAYQMAIDLNYSPLFNYDENDFVAAGPGAKRGIRKCFESFEDEQKIIMWTVENQEKEFKRLGLNFQDLWGRKLHAIDCQGLFCETDKYCRVKFPELKSNRTRIKTKYQPAKEKIEYFYPPKWGLNERIRL
ncbi:putative DNA base hypermodification protein [Patescibacteria group bacterium]|nr:putative DNA base hypermodification protein [Patescibacteria group bacterium]